MLTKSQIKYLHNLQKKKYREKENKFLFEGYRIIEEALNANFNLTKIFISNENQTNLNIKKIITLSRKQNIPLEITSYLSLEKISNTKHHQGIIALADLPKYNNTIQDNQILALYKISDPGNLGTLLRSAIWFGVKTVILSDECVDPFNPKVVRSSMGAHCFLNSILQVELDRMLPLLQSQNYSIIGAEVDGFSIEKFKFDSIKKWVLVVGGETSGIPDSIKKQINHHVSIPGKGYIDSLNAAIAGGILLQKLTKMN